MNESNENVISLLYKDKLLCVYVNNLWVSCFKPVDKVKLQTMGVLFIFRCLLVELYLALGRQDVEHADVAARFGVLSSLFVIPT